MQVSTRIVVVAVAATLMACSCGSSGATSPGGEGGAGGSSSTTIPGAGASPASAVVSFSSFAAAGNRSTDGTHMAVSSLGPVSVTSGVSRSQKYRLVGGLVATTQP